MYLSGRKLKKFIQERLAADLFDIRWKSLLQLPLTPLINSLFPFLFSMDSMIKDRAVKVMGIAVAQLAEKDMESARVIMRRLMWSLNDESGGIGWGAPEAMAEIMVNHRGLADEYHHLLLAYADRDKNYLEHEELQKGVQKGLKRLAQVRPDLKIV